MSFCSMPSKQTNVVGLADDDDDNDDDDDDDEVVELSVLGY